MPISPSDYNLDEKEVERLQNLSVSAYQDELARQLADRQKIEDTLSKQAALLSDVPSASKESMLVDRRRELESANNPPVGSVDEISRFQQLFKNPINISKVEEHQPASITPEPKVEQPKPILPSVLSKKSEVKSLPLVDKYQPKKFDEVDTELDEALKQQAKRQEFADYSRLGDTLFRIGAGIDLSTPEKQKALQEYVSSPITSLKDRREQVDKKIKREVEKAELNISYEKSDPNSPISKLYRESFKDFGVSVPDSASALSMEKVFPTLVQAKNFQESLASRRDQMRMWQEDRQLRRQELDQRFRETMDEKQDKYLSDQVKEARQAAEKSEEHKKASKALASVSSMRGLLEEAHIRGGQALSALKSQLARGIGTEVGALTEADYNKYIQNPALIPKYKATAKALATGKLTDEDYDNLVSLIDITEKKALELRSNAYSRSSTQVSRRMQEKGVKDFTPDKARYLLDPEYSPTAEPEINKPKPGSIIRLKDGKQYRVGADGDSLEPL